jgi:hypothetical protein
MYNKMKASIKLLILIAFIFSSCTKDNSSGEALGDLGYAREAEPLQKTEEEKSDEVDNEIYAERKIIKEGDITFETNNTSETTQLINNTVKQLNGYISADNIFHFDNRIEHKVTVRVPTNRFDQLVEKISSSAKNIDNKNIKAKDVTEEYIDVEARIKSKKDLEARYKEILNQANKIEDILRIENEIGKLRTEIESYEGRLRYLTNRIALSTLNITYYERIDSNYAFTGQFREAVIGGWNNMLIFLVAITHLWPFIIVGGLFIISIGIFKRRRKI